MNSKKYILIGWLLISLCAVLFVYNNKYNIHRGCDMLSINDEWEHQSMAVNYAEGFGLYKLGAFVNFEKYHIDTYDATFPFLKKIFTEYPTEYYHRAAGFTVIVGTIYKLFGTEPFYLRIFNFCLIILSWLIICLSFYKYKCSKKTLYLLLACLPIYIFLNFSYIDLIGDDTLVIFSLALIFYALTSWIRNANYINSVLLILVFLFSIFIKSTVIFIPFFILIFSLFYKSRLLFKKAFFINVVIFGVVLLYSNEINKKHQSYEYVNKDTFHKDMLSSNWNKDDSVFINQYQLHYRDCVSFDFKAYKDIAAYLFERQFYTQKRFLLSGQSLYLLIDGNNEACIRFPEKNIGSWKPYWKFNKKSFFYHFDEHQSPYIEIIKFYFYNPVLLPLIMYIKLYAGYYWNYFFIFISVAQLFLTFLMYIKTQKRIKIMFLLLSSILLHVLLHTFFLTPLIVIIFICTSFLIVKKTKHFSENILYYTCYFFIFYLMFLTLLMFGLNRYTCVVNGFELVVFIFLCLRIVKQLKSNSVIANYPLS